MNRWSKIEKNGYGYKCTEVKINLDYLVENIEGELVLRGPYDCIILEETKGIREGKKWLKENYSEVIGLIEKVGKDQLYNYSIN